MKRPPRTSRKPNLRGFLLIADAIVPCKTCGAVEGVPCEGLALPNRGVHVSRRIARLLLTAGNPAKRDTFEAAAVKELRKYIRETTKGVRA